MCSTCSSVGTRSQDLFQKPGLEEATLRVDSPGSSMQVGVDDQVLSDFLHLAEFHRSELLWLAGRMVNRREEAEDIVQQALLRAYKGLSTFRGESRMRTWLSTVVLNTAREYRRSQRGRTFLSLDSPFNDDCTAEEFDVQDERPNPEERYQRFEKQEILSEALASMSDQDRRVLRWCVLEERPYMRVATALDVSLSTLKSRVFRGKRRLRAIISSGLRGAD